MAAKADATESASGAKSEDPLSEIWHRLVSDLLTAHRGNVHTGGGTDTDSEPSADVTTTSDDTAIGERGRRR